MTLSDKMRGEHHNNNSLSVTEDLSSKAKASASAAEANSSAEIGEAEGNISVDDIIKCLGKGPSSYIALLAGGLGK